MSELSARASLRERLDEKLNPIVVKEVRAALRGRYFQVTFWTMVTIATFVGCAVLVGAGATPSETLGAEFFQKVFLCLALGLTLVVPLSAFFALGAEWEENTHDLLVLSNLRPRQIVHGKLLSVAVQVVLYLSAFLPFLAIAFLLHGLDVRLASYQLALSLLNSLFFSALAVAFSSASRNRFLRALLIAALVLLMVYVVAGGVAFLVMMGMPGMPSGGGMLSTLAAYATVVVVVSMLATAFAVTRFTHPEENRSSPLRAIATLGVFAGLVWMIVLYRIDPNDDAVFLGVGAPVAAVFALLSILFVAEPETLGRRVRQTVPANPVLALLAAPFLPGGARGLLLLLLNLAVIVATAWIATTVRTPTGSDWDGDLLHGLLGVSAYLVVYLGLPTALFARRTHRRVWRIVSRTSVLLFALLTYFVPTLVKFFLSRGSSSGRHLGNPMYLPTALRHAHEWTDPALISLLGSAAVVLALNGPRIARALSEVLEASRERRSLQAEAAADARPAS